jgi:hypothetical protein
MMLEKYSDAIIAAASDEKGGGIQFQCKFPPSLAEVKAFCDELQHRSSYAANWNAQAQKQLEERARIEAEGEPLEQRKAVAARVLAWLDERRRGKAPKVETAEQCRARLNISQAQWDAIPNAPTDKNYWQGIRPPGVLAEMLNATHAAADDEVVW